MVTFLRITSFFSGICVLAVLVLSLVGCSGASPKKPSEEARYDAAYAAGAKSFAAAQERIALYTREEMERREARRKYDEEAFWRKQRLAGK
ncbi:MAG: hypothetical protein HYY92_00555 [Parcubacteria group bacterium]|nr:hypothetical protein [Parcubacteria group bacterium]